MDVALLALGALVFTVSVGIVGRRLKKDEDKRKARQWDERERQLDRRKPVATPKEILDRRARRGERGMAPAHRMIGAVLFASEDTIHMSDRTEFLAPAGMRLPHYPVGTTLVIEYEILEGRNVLATVPKVRV